jgi:TonB family protein
MNFVENFIESSLKLLELIANAIEQGVSTFVSRLQKIARELVIFFVRMVRWAIKAIHSLWIIFMFFTAMALAVSCFMEMAFADYWLVSGVGWILFVFTLLLLVAALLRMFSPSQERQQKYQMGLPLLLVNIVFLVVIFLTLAYRPLRSPLLLWMNATAKSKHPQSNLLSSAPTLQSAVTAVKKEARAVPVNHIAPAQAPTPVPGEPQPAGTPSCTAPVSFTYTPIKVLAKVQPSRPPGVGDAGGEVELRGKVDREGKVRDLAVAKSLLVREFDEEAIRAVNQWQFAPALWNGAPTDCRLKVSVEFQPKQP